MAKQVIGVSGKVSKDRLAALGNLCIKWSILEWRVEWLIWAVQDLPRKEGREITADMQITRRLDELKTLAREHLTDQSDIDTIVGYTTAIKQLAKDRNWYVHGLWGHGTAKGEKRKVFAFSYFRRPGGRSREASVRNIDHVTGQIIAQIDMIDRFITKRLGLPLP